VPSKNPAQRLRDIVDNIDAIRDFSADMDYDSFAGDRKTLYAITRALEIISEATKRLPEELKALPEIDWVAVAAAGNIYRHEYENIDEKLIWHTVQQDLNALQKIAVIELERLLSRMPQE
jgi:uncharacterized protein with HEPN domain